MILKDARNIFIENEDVQRIRMFNEIVWEKNRPTKLSLRTSTASTSFLNSYTLTATLSEDTQQQLPVSGTIKFYEKNDNSNDTLVGTANTSIKNNISTATLTLTNKNIKTHKYYAVFEKTGKYKQSQSTNVNVTIKKDTPQFTMLGTTNIYNTWNIGVKLINSKNKALNKCTVKYGSTSKTTNSAGKAIFNISGKTEGSTLSVTYKFNGNDYYNSCSLTKQYKIQKLKTQDSKITSLKQAEKNGHYYGSSTTNCVQEWSECKDAHNTAPYQKWDIISATGESRCGRQNCYCHIIGTTSGTWKRPAPLTATFTKYNGTVKKVTFSCSHKKGKGYSNGGYPTIGQPTITLKNAGIQNDEHKINAPSTSYANKSCEWNCNVSSYTPQIVINYPANTSGETGLIFIKSLKVTIHYIPAQTAL